MNSMYSVYVVESKHNMYYDVYYILPATFSRPTTADWLRGQAGVKCKMKEGNSRRKIDDIDAAMTTNKNEHSQSIQVSRAI